MRIRVGVTLAGLLAASTPAVLVAQLAYTPAQFRGGELPQVPFQAVGGGETFLELSIGATGAVTGVRPLRQTPPFTDLLVSVARRWQFQAAEEEVPNPALPNQPKVMRPVESKVLVGAIFRPPSLNTPTFGELPKDVAASFDDTPFPLNTVMPPFPPRALNGGVVLVEVRVDAGGPPAQARVIRSAPPFDEPALDAVRRWTFQPARRLGASVPTLAYVVFGFRQPITGPGPGGGGVREPTPPPDSDEPRPK